MTVSWIQSEFPDLSNVQPLSAGGQKQVFSCTHPKDGDVVLKLISSSVDLEGIRRELLAVATIQSLRIPRIFEDGQRSTSLGSCFWIREERIHGRTLRDVLQAGGHAQLNPLDLAKQLLEVLSAAEQVEIVHRDVKPENIIQDQNNDYWLLDFGIARHLKLTSRTPTVNAFGKFTPGYAPPEQFRNIKVEIDSRADLFALGVTLFEAATGINPFVQGARDWMEVIKRVERDKLPPLNLHFDSNGSFRDLVEAMTQRRRDHRPRSVQEALVWTQSIINSLGQP